MIECPKATHGHRWLLEAVLRPSCARLLLSELPDTTPTRGRETPVGPSEKMHLLLQLLDLCSGEKKRSRVGFAFAGGVSKGKFLCYHALLINEVSKLQDVVSY
jgi:hypothetical protein